MITGARAAYWLKKVQKHPSLIDFDIPDSETWVDFLEILARRRFEPLEWKNVDPNSLNEANFPIWLAFALPRRPATVFLAIKLYRYKNSLDEIPFETTYEEFLTTHKQKFQTYFRDQLFLYKLVKPMRLLLNLPVFFGQRKRNIPLSGHNRQQLLSFSSPLNFLDKLASVAYEHGAEVAIAYLRKYEKISTWFSHAFTNEDVSIALQELSKFLDLRYVQTMAFAQIIPYRELFDNLYAATLDRSSEQLQPEPEILRISAKLLESFVLTKGGKKIEINLYLLDHKYIVAQEKVRRDKVLLSPKYKKIFKDPGLAYNYHKSKFVQKMKFAYQLAYHAIPEPSILEEAKSKNQFRYVSLEKIQSYLDSSLTT